MTDPKSAMEETTLNAEQPKDTESKDLLSEILTVAPSNVHAAFEMLVQEMTAIRAELKNLKK